MLPAPTSFDPCCVHAVPFLVHTQTAPVPALSVSPPTSAVLPSPDSATPMPCPAFPAAPVPTSLAPCVQTPSLRVQIHAAPTLLLVSPPTIAVLPSAEIETDTACVVPAA